MLSGPANNQKTFANAAECLRQNRVAIVERWKACANQSAFAQSLPKVIDLVIKALEAEKRHGGSLGSVKLAGIPEAPVDLNHLLADYTLLRQVIFATLDEAIMLSSRERDIILDTLDQAKSFMASQCVESTSVQRLRESEERYKTFFDLAPFAIAEVDASTRQFLQVNQSYCRLLGYTKDELKRLTVEDVTHPEDSPADLHALKEMHGGHRDHYRNEKRYLRKDGSSVWVEIGVATVRDQNGAARFNIAVVVDISERKAAEERLRILQERLAENELEYRTVFEAAGSGKAIVSSKTRRLLQANRKLSEITGYSHNELLEMTIEDLTFPEDRSVSQQSFANGIQNSKSDTWTIEKRYVRKDQQVIWVMITGSNIRNEKGEVEKVVSVVNDITERKTAQNEILRVQQRLELALDSSAIGLFDLNLDTGVAELTPQVAKIMGLEPGRLSVCVSEIRARTYPDDLPRVNESFRAAVEEGKEYLVDYRLMMPDGSIRWINAKGRVERNLQGHPIRMLGANTDITDRMQALQNLEEERELREQLISTITHDLRTPLTVAKLNTQLAARKAANRDAVLAFTVKCNEALIRADKMIQNLLDASRIRAGQGLSVEFDECDLGELAREVSDELMAAHGIQFKVSAPVTLCGIWSCGELRRAIENLLTNAIKYGDVSRPISVEVRPLHDEVEISVHNWGDPIRSEELPKLFDSFARARTSEGKAKGWGLGLALVKGVAEAHGGSVAAKSTPESGTTFTITLPMDSRVKVS